MKDNIHYKRDLEFYTGLQHQARRPDTPDILKQSLIAYENHMTRNYDVTLEDLRAKSAVLHYEREFKSVMGSVESGDLEKIMEEKE